MSEDNYENLELDSNCGTRILTEYFTKDTYLQKLFQKQEPGYLIFNIITEILYKILVITKSKNSAILIFQAEEAANLASQTEVKVIRQADSMSISPLPDHLKELPVKEMVNLPYPLKVVVLDDQGISLTYLKASG